MECDILAVKAFKKWKRVGGFLKTKLTLLLARNLRGKPLALALLVEVRRYRHRAAPALLAQGVEFGDGGVTGRGVARGYVYLCTAADEAFADHTADTFGAAGDEDDFVAHAEEGVGVHCDEGEVSQGCREGWSRG